MEEDLLLLEASVAVPPLAESINKYCWPNGSDFATTEELMMMSDLVDEAALSSSPVQQQEEEEPRRQRESMLNKLISTVYSGPTISDIESALSFTGADQAAAVDAHIYNSAGPVVFSPEKVLSKMENKYTLKIKTCGNGLAEDGYKWRKYGQKSIKNSPNPRSYYRCTNPRCNAKKQVERSTEEADTLVVTYEGLHLHYTYSHFLQPQPQPQPQQPKKPKLGGPPPQPQPIIMLEDLDGPAQQDITTCPLDATAMAPAPPPAALCYLDDMFQKPAFFEEELQQQHITNGGLLEDMVPLLVRRPCSSTGATTTTTGSSTTSSSPQLAPSPDLSTSSSVSWNPTSPYIDMAILSNIF
ncbi:uncharacterized protein LOC8074138 [Sorghum bicolor]|uniref:WRKY domain-containing protein n=1 Tax=Sorghum bicolor TaxID=4558 RepID=C5XJE1_SORBI|nr:uncharacterized protein LOC8074138 [Sorghum bicolor]EES04299.1 hypothetical protein SORBI_3003G444000 [Sorghum bicolor]|eukprot:XP_002459179.1 uncharacterized protein LOC8074138 [Sorghum bicolor]